MKQLSLLIGFTSVFVTVLGQELPDVSAKFPGGLDSLYRIVQRNLVYPPEARANNMEGRVFVEFIVDEGGKIEEGSVRSVLKRQELLELEAVRAVRACTVSWKPGTLNGQPARQKFTLPIIFSLSDPKPMPLLTAKPTLTGIDLALGMDTGEPLLNSPILDPGYISPGQSFFGLTTSSSEVQTGECLVVELAFYVPDDNKRRIQFWNLGSQVAQMFNQIEKDYCWNVRAPFRNIVAETIKLEGKGYTKYSIYRAAQCPTKPGLREYPAIKLVMLASADRFKGDTTFVQTPYLTRPSVVKVNKSMTSNLVGRFIVRDSIQHGDIFAGQRVKYQITVAGEGLTYPLAIRSIVRKTWKAEPVIVENADSIRANTYYSAKTITYDLTFHKEGEYDLAEGIGFDAVDPFGKKVDRLSPDRVVRVKPSKGPPPASRKVIDQKGIIAIDASQSMLIEDVLPNRLAMIREGVANFLASRPCDIGLLAFGGNVVSVPVHEGENCFSRKKVLGIDTKQVQSGTALGEAIWEVSHPIGSMPKISRLVIISDGDNTAGRINVSDALRTAAENKVRVFTIGVGMAGLVPFGSDFLGKKIMVTNTFSDVDLKRIAKATGGTYTWASTSTDLKDALTKIFSVVE